MGSLRFLIVFVPGWRGVARRGNTGLSPSTFFLFFRVVCTPFLLSCFLSSPAASSVLCVVTTPPRGRLGSRAQEFEEQQHGVNVGGDHPAFLVFLAETHAFV